MTMELREKINGERATVLDYLAKHNKPVNAIKLNQETMQYWPNTEEAIDYLESKGLTERIEEGLKITKKGLKIYSLLKKVGTEIDKKEKKIVVKTVEDGLERPRLTVSRE